MSSPGVVMPYTVSKRDDLTRRQALRDADQAHRVRQCAAALRRAAGVQDLEAVGRLLVERQVGVAEDDDVHTVAEAAAHPLEPARTRPGVVDHSDPGFLG